MSNQNPSPALPSLLSGPSVEPPNIRTMENLYILTYIHGNSRHVQEMNFHYFGSFKAAIERGRRFCEHMHYRFLKVSPFLMDLDKFEKRAADLQEE